MRMDRLIDWLRLHGHQPSRSQAAHILATAPRITRQGSLYAPEGPRPFYSTQEYHPSLPDLFVVSQHGTTWDLIEISACT